MARVMLVAGRGVNVDVAVVVASLRAMTETATAKEGDDRCSTTARHLTPRTVCTEWGDS